MVSAMTAQSPAEIRNAALEEALTPSAETKAAYIGEFKFPHVYKLPSGAERTYMLDVPWTTIKEIMKAIKARALISSTPKPVEQPVAGDDVVERVARAIYDILEGPIADQSFTRQVRQWELSQKIARAALAAIQPEGK